jgi:hypothetical protein
MRDGLGPLSALQVGNLDVEVLGDSLEDGWNLDRAGRFLAERLAREC